MRAYSRLALESEQNMKSWQRLPEGFINTLKLCNNLEELPSKALAAAVLDFKNSPETVYFWTFGQHAPQGTQGLGQERQVDPFSSQFDLASLTKIIGTTTLSAQLFERGWLSFDQTVQSVFSEFPHTHITLAHLLNHSSGYAAWAPIFEQLRAAGIEKPASVKKQWLLQQFLTGAIVPEAAPGSRTVYSDLGFLLLGFVLEELGGQGLEQMVKLPEIHYRPLGCHPQSPANAVVTELCPWRGLLQGQVHDDNTWALGGVAPHAGLFGSLASVVHWFSDWYSGRIVQKKTVEQIWSPFASGRTLGWDTPSPTSSSCGSLFSSRSVGHLGFTGTSLWFDRDAEILIVLLTNRVYPTRENLKIREFRPRFHDAIRRDLVQTRV